jgi:hypothetical protein
VFKNKLFQILKAIKKGMRNLNLIFGLIIFSFFSCITVNAQPVNETHLMEIKARSELWNTSYNSRDSLSFYTLFDSLALLSSAGGRWIGAEDCKKLCRFLYAIRPDISWINKYSKIEINERIHVAYETGDWTEDWTESGDTGKSRLTGKYWIMWRFENDNWFIISAIFTPLTCEGSYCNRKK